MSRWDKFTEEDKMRMDGGRNQPITRPQLTKIHNLAQKLGYSANQVAIAKFNKSISQLTGSEANQLIRRLQEKLDEAKNG